MRHPCISRALWILATSGLGFALLAVLLVADATAQVATSSENAISQPAIHVTSREPNKELRSVPEFAQNSETYTSGYPAEAASYRDSRRPGDEIAGSQGDIAARMGRLNQELDLVSPEFAAYGAVGTNGNGSPGASRTAYYQGNEAGQESAVALARTGLANCSSNSNGYYVNHPHGQLAARENVAANSGSYAQPSGSTSPRNYVNRSLVNVENGRRTPPTPISSTHPVAQRSTAYTTSYVSHPDTNRPVAGRQTAGQNYVSPQLRASNSHPAPHVVSPRPTPVVENSNRSFPSLSQTAGNYPAPVQHPVPSYQPSRPAFSTPAPRVYHAPSNVTPHFQAPSFSVPRPMPMPRPAVTPVHYSAPHMPSFHPQPSNHKGDFADLDLDK